MTTIELFRTQPGKEIAAGAVIFREGDPGEEMYVVQEGRVEIRVGEEVVETLGPGEIFGELALIDDQPRSATAVAVTASRVAAVPEARFHFMVQQTPRFALQVMRVMAERLRRATAQAR